ncbi:MAG: hypothetical protein ACN4GW_07855 [Desulforhopalus sp.]
MRKIIILLLFVAFAVICGVELGSKFLLSTQRDTGSALFTASSLGKGSDKENTTKAIDYRKMIEATNTRH